MGKAMENYYRWHDFHELDEELRAEVEAMKRDSSAIEECFGSGLEFGTAGLRGIIGAGTNRMNIYTVRKASLGLARFILKNCQLPQSVAISYDNRRKSRLFAEETAKVLAENGINALIFDEMQPTPLLSFAVLDSGSIAGVMVTASHNPKEYNGYKVYWSHGGQVVEEYALPLMREFDAIEDELSIKVTGFDKGIESGLIRYIGADVTESYIGKVIDLATGMIPKPKQMGIPIVFTPLHGTGARLVPEVLRRAGFFGIRYVESQMMPDTEFSTTAKPNPEEPEVYKLGLEIAKSCGASLVMATDPDADRLGAMCRENDGTFRLITGNQMGALLIDFITATACRELEGSVMIKTIVTSDLGAKVAKKSGVEVIEVLTGFKYIGELIDKFEREGSKSFLFGYEESYGYLAGSFVRDKDAIQIALLVVCMAAYHAERGMSLGDRLDALYEEYGCFVDEVVNITLAGIEGQRRIEGIMSSLRQEPPFVIGVNRILSTADYVTGRVTYADGRDFRATGLPESNVLKYVLEDGSWVCVRPSGTEPKLKIYIGAQAKEKRQAQAKADSLKLSSRQLVESRG